MTVSIVYHTRFGNNAAIARRLSDRLESDGCGVSVHPISEARTSEIPGADLYIVGSPTQLGSLPMRMQRFLKHMTVSPDAAFAAFATWAQPGSGAPKKLESVMACHGARKIKDALVLSVKDLKGPMEEDWEEKVDAWAAAISAGIQS